MAWSTSAATPVFPGRIRPCRMHHALPGAVQKEEDSVMPVYRVAFEEQGGSRVACQIHAALDANHLALAVIGHDLQPSRNGVTKVMQLTALGPGDRCHVLRPAPAGLVDAASDGRLVEVDDLNSAVWERPNVGAFRQHPRLESRHLPYPFEE